MTHSHDRTLLSSLGFADRDKGDSMHDLACEYLSHPDQVRRLVQLVEPEAVIPSVPSVLVLESTVEFQLIKGRDQYRTTIGFLDVHIRWRREDKKGVVVVEVKIGSVTTGDIVRQINLYREYLSDNSSFSVTTSTFKEKLREMNGSSSPISTKWVLATGFDIDAGQADLLRRENIYPIRLGAGFAAWYEERLKQSAPKIEEF